MHPIRNRLIASIRQYEKVARLQHICGNATCQAVWAHCLNTDLLQQKHADARESLRRRPIFQILPELKKNFFADKGVTFKVMSTLRCRFCMANVCQPEHELVVVKLPFSIRSSFIGFHYNYVAFNDNQFHLNSDASRFHAKHWSSEHKKEMEGSTSQRRNISSKQLEKEMSIYLHNILNPHKWLLQ